MEETWSKILCILEKRKQDLIEEHESDSYTSDDYLYPLSILDCLNKGATRKRNNRT